MATFPRPRFFPAGFLDSVTPLIRSACEVSSHSAAAIGSVCTRHRQAVPKRLSTSRPVTRCAAAASADGLDPWPSSLNISKLFGANEMVRAHEVTMEVRDHELDQFGVVSNAMYANYCQQGRHELLREMGMSVSSIVKEKRALALSNLSLSFIAPLRSGDRFVVTTRVVGSTAARVYIEHENLLLPQRELVAQSRVTVVVLDSNYHPTRIPAEFKGKLNLLIRSEGKS
eukprot:TRINITY_DN3338_c0_g1_i1.p1 TRINITY_DN3338_c0_g1~~TRINITY_DN3338_c0_g1_i1.p1  ORF type:complete len:243 (+),score=28.42 TRINITY_DN3338_c0_g1_i1:48-731(+)